MQEINPSAIETTPALNPFQLVLEAGPVSLTVLFILLVFSLVSWAIIFSKWTTLRLYCLQSEPPHVDDVRPGGPEILTHPKPLW